MSIASINQDDFEEYNNKIFADVFEAILGAVFIDSKSLSQVWRVFLQLVGSRTLESFGDISNFKENAKTKLYDFWNKLKSTKGFRLLFEV